MSINRRDFVALSAGALGLPWARSNAARSVPSMLRPTVAGGFSAQVLTTVGDAIGGYRPPGIMDGTAAWQWDADTVRLFVNHELAARLGYSWELDNGVVLRGSRISWFDVDRKTRALKNAGQAIRQVRDRRGQLVTRSQQINERWERTTQLGFDTLCSAQGYRAGEFGFTDDLMFTNEEVSAREDHPHGGSIWALDVRSGTLWALPELGRGAWENVTAVATPDQHKPDGRVALLLGDDLEFGSAPLYLWVGRKQPGGNLPARNGLSQGRLYVWVAAEGWRSPADWRGTGNKARGRFVPIASRSATMAGEKGHDRDGYLDDLTLRAVAVRKQAFMFSRPEDLHTNPANPSEVVFCSCGHGIKHPNDEWGTTYLVNVMIPSDPAGTPTADLTILFDGDDTPGRGIRSPDSSIYRKMTRPGRRISWCRRGSKRLSGELIRAM